MKKWNAKNISESVTLVFSLVVYFIYSFFFFFAIFLVDRWKCDRFPDVIQESVW